MTGISRHTIFDWHKKNTNPGSDKIMVICEALEITPEELLIGRHKDNNFSMADIIVYTDSIEAQILKGYRELSDSKKKRLLAYVSMLMNMKE